MDLLKIDIDSVPNEVNSALLAEFYSNLECPVCRNYMSPRIPECENKHSICRDCYQKVETCPLCRCPKRVAGYSCLLEEVYRALIIPCKYRENGCQFTCKGEFIRIHQVDCTYRDRPCPISKSRECSWSGPLKDFRSHLLDKHCGNFYENNRFTFCLEGYKENRRYIYFTVVLYCYEKYFRLTSTLDKTGMSKWAVYCIDEPSEARKFAYELIFHQRENPLFSHIVIWKSPCTSAPNDDSFVIPSKCLHANIHMLDSFCHAGGYLSYTLTITQNSNQRTMGHFRTIFGFNINTLTT